MNDSLRDQYRRQAWPQPLHAQTEHGEPRRVGVELEFIGLSVEAVADQVQRCFGGRVEAVSEYEIDIQDTRHGDYTVELDMTYLKERGRTRDSDDSDPLEDLAENVIASVARRLVPVEIVSPPIAMHELWELEDLVAAVRASGAKGTKHSPTYAFGLHLNPELPATDADTLRRYLQAFLCLYPWLLERSAVDVSRRVTPYIDPFPEAYLKRLLAPDYAASQSQLIDDYLELNPTRNRALDMLPLFAHLDEQRVRCVVEDRRVNARPTLHYRLPNCQLDEPDWHLVRPWRDFLQLDALAAQPELLAKACAQCLERSDKLGDRLFGNWAEAAYAWVLPELL